MTMELVTGHAGGPHVTAAQDAALHAGVIGGDDYVLSTKDRFAINVVSANKVTIAGGDLVMQGYHASSDKPADLIITNGSQGQKRNDIICCRYTKVGDSIESANLVVVKGTPTTGTPVDPTLNTTPISQGATTYDMALYRVPLNGITIGEPEPMFNILQPMSSVWDSLTQMPDIESGMFIGSTSVNGAVSIKWGRHSTAPFAVFVTYAPNNNDSVTNSFTPLIWSVGDSDFQARLRDDRSHAWGGAQPVRLYWLATWKR